MKKFVGGGEWTRDYLLVALVGGYVKPGLHCDRGIWSDLAALWRVGLRRSGEILYLLVHESPHLVGLAYLVIDI